MSFSHTNKSFENDIKNLQLNFTQILTSDSLNTTSEIINHIKYINNGLDNIKLDYEFHRETKKNDSNETNKLNIKQLITKGNELTREMNSRLQKETMKTKELNQIREIHNWACDSLAEYLQALHPYASNSYARLDNLAHNLGVTDRYVGYRNNLTRFENTNTIWADRKLPQTSTPDWRNWSHAFQHNIPSTTATTIQQPSNNNRNFISALETTESRDIQRPNKSRKIPTRSFTYTNDHNSHMIRAGMSTNYPGESETFDRFSKAKGSSYSPSLAVAQPNYTSIGRPLARLVSKSSFSEYTDRYTFPDTSRLERYPWLRS